MHYLTENIDSKPIVKLAVSSGGAFTINSDNNVGHC